MEKRPVTEGIIRYLRPASWLRPTRDDERILYTYENLGGIVFAITIDHEAEELVVAWSICREDDNFSKEFGRSQALQRLAEKKAVVLAYEKESDLITNIVIKVANKLTTFASRWEHDEAQLRTLRETLDWLVDWDVFLDGRPKAPLIKAMK